MTSDIKIKLNLDSGEMQERTLITAFKYNEVKYLIFDGESTGSMGLPVILVCKDQLGKVVGITDAEEWKNTKECLKKIISGDTVEYAGVTSEMRADNIYYRQLTLPIASFDLLKSSYKAPEVIEQSAVEADNTPVFEQITPEDISASDISSINPVSADSFNSQDVSVSDAIAAVESDASDVSDASTTTENSAVNYVDETPVSSNAPQTVELASEVDKAPSSKPPYDEIKAEFMKYAEKLFDLMYDKINHND